MYNTGKRGFLQQIGCIKYDVVFNLCCFLENIWTRWSIVPIKLHLFDRAEKFTLQANEILQVNL